MKNATSKTDDVKTDDVKTAPTILNSDEYNEMLQKIAGISQHEIIARSTPIRKCITEAETLYRWSTHDKSILIEWGLAPEKIDLLQPAAGTLRHAEALVSSMIEDKDAWREESPEAFALHDTIRHIFLFAYRSNPVVLSKVRAMLKGSSRDDKIQQLANFREIGRKHGEELKELNFDLSLLDKASELSARMGDLLGESLAKEKAYVDACTIRDQAYTFLKNLMNEVRDYGRFVFYRNKERLHGYVSAYNRKLRSKNDVKEEASEVTEHREAA